MLRHVDILEGNLHPSLLIQATNVMYQASYDGGIEGKVARFSINGMPIALKSDDILQEDGKAWIVTEKYGRVRVAGAADRNSSGMTQFSGFTSNGGIAIHMIEGNVTPVSYVIAGHSGASIWVKPSQRGPMMKDATTWLLGYGADIAERNADGQTRLSLAAWCGYAEVVRSLLARGADANTKDDDNWTPLHYAARYGFAQVALQLLNHKAAVDVKTTEGDTALQWAVCNGCYEVVKVLAAHKADLNLTDKEGHTPLHWAISNNHPDIAAFLRNRGGRE